MMKNKIASLALILSFAASMALAGEKNKNEKGAPVVQPVSATQDSGKNVNKSAKAKKSKSNNKTQETPSEERQYQQALFGIYG
jgi:hypothetical protein